MIVLSNSASQTLQPGQSILFDTTIEDTKNSCCNRNNRRNNGGTVQFRANGCYSISFGANVSGETAATAVQLSIQLGGATLPETTMISVPAAVGDLNSVSKTTLVSNNSCGCGCGYDRISVTNTGTVPIVVGANSSLAIHKISCC